MKALGMVEVKGYLAATEALDSALKAANVSLVDVIKVTGGLVTVMVEGDVEAVKAAMEASQAAVKGLGDINSVSVIPRPTDDVARMLDYKGNLPTNPPNPGLKENPIETDFKNLDESDDSLDSDDIILDTEEPEDPGDSQEAVEEPKILDDDAEDKEEEKDIWDTSEDKEEKKDTSNTLEEKEEKDSGDSSEDVEESEDSDDTLEQDEKTDEAEEAVKIPESEDDSADEVPSFWQF